MNKIQDSANRDSGRATGASKTAKRFGKEVIKDIRHLVMRLDCCEGERVIQVEKALGESNPI